VLSRFFLVHPEEPALQEPELQNRALIPLWVKIVYTYFVAALVPFYLMYYGPANFLWFCDIALLLTVPALWLESRFLTSMQFIAAFLGSMAWLVDFLPRLIAGYHVLGITAYMFRPDIPLVIRIFSLFHGWLPFLLLWMVCRLGYDRRGWLAQSLLSCVVLPICFVFTDPIRSLNGVFGPSGEKPQTWMDPWLFLAVVTVFYPLGLYLPAHLLAIWAFRKRS
jgi:hypothetical protein